ncbi:MAG: cytochrome c [Rhodospirillaceae bacterium]|nr:cytochrome c [Rhodospirillaceae bacterium]
MANTSFCRWLVLGVLAASPLSAQTAAEAPAPTAPVVDPVLAQGEYVARAANCVACHSVPDAPAFSGGLKMATPIGNIYATNITPDPETGIGSYTLADFDKAVRRGVAKDGHHLYPAMPYPSYAKMTDADIAALYAYFTKVVPAAKMPNKPSEIPPVLNWRWPLKFWNMLFADFDVYQPKADKDAAWNRGAYLVQGPGHCGACHTPRGLFFNEKALDESDPDFLAGAMLDHWTAVNLTQDVNSGLGRWSHEDIVTSLKTGQTPFGTAFGTMIEVINNSTQFLTDDDLNAMAVYLKSLPGVKEKNAKPWAYSAASTEALRKRDLSAVGAKEFLQKCEACHVDDGKGQAQFLPPLAGNPALLDKDPSSAINVVLNGSMRLVVDGMPDGYRMPPFRALMNDQEVANVATYIRNSWGNAAPLVTAKEVKAVRDATDFASDKVIVLRMK